MKLIKAIICCLLLLPEQVLAAAETILPVTVAENPSCPERWTPWP